MTVSGLKKHMGGMHGILALTTGFTRGNKRLTPLGLGPLYDNEMHTLGKIVSPAAPSPFNSLLHPANFQTSKPIYGQIKGLKRQV